ncbi:MAG: GNAT family N-acetyltransferase [Burkholderiaceae bacterium]
MEFRAVEIHALSPERQADYLAFFDGEAFSDNPKWASCYCQCFYEDHRVVRWSALTAVDNRGSACRRIAEGTMRGYLAYREGRVVGWCNAAPRALLHALDEEAPITAPAETGTIVCFLVAPGARGQGIARALLDAACDGLRAQGLRRVEANPRMGTDDPGANHYGPLSLYLAAGFTRLRDDGDGSVWVGKVL